jgi:hypothetical protein
MSAGINKAGTALQAPHQATCAMLIHGMTAVSYVLHHAAMFQSLIARRWRSSILISCISGDVETSIDVSWRQSSTSFVVCIPVIMMMIILRPGIRWAAMCQLRACEDRYLVQKEISTTPWYERNGLWLSIIVSTSVGLKSLANNVVDATGRRGSIK